MELFLFILGCALIAATAVTLVRADAWWIRVFDFPRLQIAVVMGFTFVAYFIFLERFDAVNIAFLFFLLLGLLYQSYMMFPYTRFASKQVQESRNPVDGGTFGLLFANVLMSNRNARRLTDLIRASDPDIILTAETDDWWAEQMQALEATHPYVVKQPQGNTYGMILYSRLELRGAKVRFLLTDDIPSIHARVLLRSGTEVEIRCLHPRPPFPTEDETSTARDGELLIVGKDIRNIDAPAVVFGDLNDVAWSRSNYLFQDISGLLDPRIGRGFFHTFHASYPFIRFPLDHFFHSNHFRLVDFKRLSYFGSDHFPVYIKLSYEPDAAIVQEKLDAEASEKVEACEKIEAALTAEIENK